MRHLRRYFRTPARYRDCKERRVFVVYKRIPSLLRPTSVRSGASAWSTRTALRYSAHDGETGRSQRRNLHRTGLWRAALHLTRSTDSGSSSTNTYATSGLKWSIIGSSTYEGIRISSAHQLTDKCRYRETAEYAASKWVGALFSPRRSLEAIGK